MFNNNRWLILSGTLSFIAAFIVTISYIMIWVTNLQNIIRVLSFIHILENLDRIGYWILVMKTICASPLAVVLIILLFGIGFSQMQHATFKKYY